VEKFLYQILLGAQTDLKDRSFGRASAPKTLFLGRESAPKSERTPFLLIMLKKDLKERRVAPAGKGVGEAGRKAGNAADERSAILSKAAPLELPQFPIVECSVNGVKRRGQLNGMVAASVGFA
jgi:hypothetical protein